MRNKINMAQTVQSRPHIISRKEKNCYLLVNRKNGVVLAVDNVGIEIWNYMSNRTTVREIVERLMKKYGVGLRDSRRETLKFLEKLSKNGFLYTNGHEAP